MKKIFIFFNVLFFSVSMTIQSMDESGSMEEEIFQICSKQKEQKGSDQLDRCSWNDKFPADSLSLTIAEGVLYKAEDFANDKNLNTWAMTPITKDTVLLKVTAKCTNENLLASAPQYFPAEDIIYYYEYHNHKTSKNSSQKASDILRNLKIESFTNVEQSPTLAEEVQDLKKNLRAISRDPKWLSMAISLNKDGLIKKEEQKTLSRALSPEENKKNENLAPIKPKPESTKSNLGLYAKLGLFAGIGLALYLKPSLFFEPLNYLFGGWWQHKIEN